MSIWFKTLVVIVSKHRFQIALKRFKILFFCFFSVSSKFALRAELELQKRWMLVVSKVVKVLFLNDFAKNVIVCIRSEQFDNVRLLLIEINFFWKFNVVLWFVSEQFYINVPVRVDFSSKNVNHKSSFVKPVFTRTRNVFVVLNPVKSLKEYLVLHRNNYLL